MHDRLLDDIIQLEKVLQQQLEDEKERVKQWVEQERALLEPLLAQAAQERDRAYVEALEAAREHVEAEGAKQRQTAQSYSQWLHTLPAATLQEVLKRVLPRVLPEGDHDCPHGQG